jgi:hypothetical protein
MASDSLRPIPAAGEDLHCTAATDGMDTKADATATMAARQFAARLMMGFSSLCAPFKAYRFDRERVCERDHMKRRR